MPPPVRAPAPWHTPDVKPFTAILTNPEDATIPSFLNACKTGDLATVEQLANGRNLADGSLSFGLYKALEAGHKSVPRELLQCEVNIDERAIKLTKTQGCFQALIDHGLLEEDFEGGLAIVALGRIVTLNNEPLLRWFFAQGTDLDGHRRSESSDMSDGQGLNPTLIRSIQSDDILDAAALYSTSSVIDFLLAQGAKLKNSHVLHSAVIALSRIVTERIAMMDHLVKFGADLNLIGVVPGSNYGGTPLHAAATFGRMEEAKLLLENGANVNKKNPLGQLPSHECVRQGRQDMRELYKKWELK